MKSLSLLSLAAENLGEGVDVTADVVPGEVPDEEIEQSLAEGDTEAALAEDQSVVTSGQELSGLVGQHDQGEVIAKAVADINAGIEKALGSEDAPGPGFTPVEAQSVTTALEALRRVVGFGHEEHLKVSLEAFGPSESRVAATRALAVEASNTLAAIGQGLANTWNKILTMLRQFVRNALQVGARELKRSETFVKVAQSMRGAKEPGDQTLNNDSIARVLSIDGKPPTKERFFNNWKLAWNEPVLTSYAVADALDRMVAAGFNFEDSGKTQQAAKVIFGVLGVGSEETFQTERWFGGWVIEVARRHSQTSAPSVSVQINRKQSAESESSELQVLSVDECQRLAAECVKQTKRWMEGNKKLAAAADNLEREIRNVDQRMNKKEILRHGEVESINQRNSGLNMVKAVLPVARKLMEQDLAVIKAALDWTQGSLRTVRAQTQGA